VPRKLSVCFEHWLRHLVAPPSSSSAWYKNGRNINDNNTQRALNAKTHNKLPQPRSIRKAECQMNTVNPESGSYTHFPSPMKSYLLSVLAILVCAVPSAFGAWMLWKSIGLSGVTLSVATALSAMVLATALFALLSALRNRLFAKQESRKGE
jgi:hypothetical protein